MNFDYLLVASTSDIDIRNQHEVARHLESCGHSTAMLMPMAENTEGLDSPSKIFSLEELDEGAELDPETIERRFGVPSCRQLCHTECRYYNLSYERVLQRAKSLAAIIDRLFTEHEFEYAYQGRGGELFRLLVHHGMKVRNRHNIWIAFTPFTDSWVFSTHLNNTWNTYETVPYEEMSPADIKRTETFIQKFKEDRKRYTHTPPIKDESEDTGIQSVLRRLRSLTSSFTGSPTAYEYQNERSERLRQWLRTTVQCRLNEFFTLDRNDSLRRCRNNRFVLYPLQFPDESRLTLFSPEFFDQGWIIKYIARSLPDGVDLFVKPHPNHPGHYSPAWVRNLAQRSNIQFIDQSLNAHTGIEHAEATVVVNNTVGFESLFYETPLIVLGNAFYRYTPTAHRVRSLENLDKILSDCIAEGVSREDRIASLYSLRESVFNLSNTDKFENYMKETTNALTSFVQSEL